MVAFLPWQYFAKLEPHTSWTDMGMVLYCSSHPALRKLVWFPKKFNYSLFSKYRNATSQSRELLYIWYSWSVSQGNTVLQRCLSEQILLSRWRGTCLFGTRPNKNITFLIFLSWNEMQKWLSQLKLWLIAIATSAKNNQNMIFVLLFFCISFSPIKHRYTWNTSQTSNWSYFEDTGPVRLWLA